MRAEFPLIFLNVALFIALIVLLYQFDSIKVKNSALNSAIVDTLNLTPINQGSIKWLELNSLEEYKRKINDITGSFGIRAEIKTEQEIIQIKFNVEDYNSFLGFLYALDGFRGFKVTDFVIDSPDNQKLSILIKAKVFKLN